MAEEPVAAFSETPGLPSTETKSPTAGKATDTVSAVSLSSFIVFLASYSNSQTVREVLTYLAPSLGVAITYIARASGRQFFHWRGNQQIKSWIRELKVERVTARQPRKTAIDRELLTLESRLAQRRLDNLP